jgi:hypothetical protein
MTVKWYFINITDKSESDKSIQIFTGYFKVNNNFIVEFYEEIDGKTDFSKNILISTKFGSIDGHHYYGETGEITIYNYDGYQYDNIYPSDWKQFDFHGVLISSMSRYTTSSVFNLSANTTTGEYLTNIGGVESNEYTTFNALFNIQPITDPTIKNEIHIYESIPNNILNKNTAFISNICFPPKTPITTDQGIIFIDKIDPNIHSINQKKIIAITKTITLDNYLVCFEKNSLGSNIPSQKTIISKNHIIFYKNKMLKAYDFINKFNGVYKIKYDGVILYNVLMEDYNKMFVNNLLCETLNPQNIIVKLNNILKNITLEQKEKLIQNVNEYIIKKHIYNSNKNRFMSLKI